MGAESGVFAPRHRLTTAGLLMLVTFVAFESIAVATAMPTWAVAGLGMGLGMPSLGVLLLAASPEGRRGADSAALQIADATGSALCIGLTGVLVAAATAGAFPLRVAVLGAVVSRRAGSPLPAPAVPGDAVRLATS